MYYMYIRCLRVWFLVPIMFSVKVSDDNDADDDSETTVMFSLCVCLLIYRLGHILHIFICAAKPDHPSSSHSAIIVTLR